MKFMQCRVKAVQFKVPLGGIYGWLRDINAGSASFGATKRTIEREATRIRETVQDTLTTRIFAQYLTFVALIKKKTSFLALPEIDEEFDAILVDLYAGRNASGNDNWLLNIQPFTTTRLAIV